MCPNSKVKDTASQLLYFVMNDSYREGFRLLVKITKNIKNIEDCQCVLLIFFNKRYFLLHDPPTLIRRVPTTS
jgi:hypothetical protein